MVMLDKFIKPILYITGIITMLPVLQFILPHFMLQQQGLSAGNDTGLLFAQHWGLLVFCIGGLIVYAANNPTFRTPVLVVAIIEKLGLIYLVASQWQNPALQGFHLPIYFDIFCVLIYVIYLMSNRKAIIGSE
jgi:hypothetical protein